MNTAKDIAGKLTDLAERCEQATGPDLELDARIECELSYGGAWEQLSREGYAPSDFKAPAYTASLDASGALDLRVPEEAGAVFWRSGHDGEGPDQSRFFAEVMVCDSVGCTTSRAVADTEPLARTAARLRARSILQESSK